MGRRRRPRLILRPYADANFIFVVAEQFWNASRWMLATRQKWPSDMQMVPLTCASFALELYFKCLLSSEIKAADDEHNLRKLFDQLDRKTKEAIRKNVDLKMMTNAITVVHDSWRAAKKRGPPPDVDFDFLLDVSAEAFTLTRYIHEYGLPAKKGWIADPILNATRATILKRYPDWIRARQASPKAVFTE